MAESLRKYTGLDLGNAPSDYLRNQLQKIDLFLKSVYGAVGALEAAPAGSGQGAPVGASYVVVALDATLSNERRLVGTSPITITDNGAGVSVAVGLNVSALASQIDGTPTNTYGSTGADGTSELFIETDAQLPFPQALKSTTGGLSELLLEDNSVDQTLTGSLGDLFIVPADGLVIPVVTTFSTVVGGSGVTIDRTDDSLILAVRNFADTSGFQEALQFAVTANNTTAGSNFVTGVRGKVNNINTRGDGTTLRGVWADARSTGVGYTRPELTGFFTGVQFTADDATSLITNMHGFWAATPTRAGAADVTNSYGLRLSTRGFGTNIWGIHCEDRATIQSQSAEVQTVLNLIQLATGNVAGAHLNLDDKAGDPPSPNDGDLWRNGIELNYYNGVSITDLVAGGAGGGDSFLEWAGL